MRNFAKKLAATTGVAVALAAALTGTAQAAEPAQGCVGVPEWGSLYYWCLSSAPTATVPYVNVFGQTPVGATVPAICYYLGCTPTTPVQQSVPVNVYYNEPTTSTSIFEIRTNCYDYYGGCYDSTYSYYTYYRVYYNHISDTCQFQTNDPNLSAVSYPRVACAI